MRSTVRVLLLAVLVTCVTGVLAGTAFAQQGQINGVVSDSSGGVIPGATVTAIEAGTGFSQTAVSGANGRYSFPSLRPIRSEEHTSELQSPCKLVCSLLLEKKKVINI